MTVKKVLITGGNGNLGRLLAMDFEARDISVVAFDLPNEETRSDNFAGKRTFIEGDIRDTDRLAEILKR